MAGRRARCYAAGMSYFDRRPGVVLNTADLSRYRPLLWIVAACVAFWAGLAWAWPWWVAGLFAAFSGLFLAYGLGAGLRHRIADWRDDRALAEEARVEAVRDAAREAIQANQENDDGRT